MRFRAFAKIPTHRAAPPRAMGGPWVALEKLHGAQLVVGYDGGELRVGKRKAWLAADEPFFGWQLIASELAAGVAAMARATGAAQVVAFGELIGGAYPHPDVPVVPGLSAVQTGIWYTPALAWVPFDLLVASGDDDVDLGLAFPAAWDQLAEAAQERLLGHARARAAALLAPARAGDGC